MRHRRLHGRLRARRRGPAPSGRLGWDDKTRRPPEALASTRTGQYGFYEITLEPGSYLLCNPNGEDLAFANGTEVTIEKDAALRRDYAIALLEGWTVDL